MYKINDKIITFIPPENIEVEALDQIHNISEMPFLFHHVAVMPDCHMGKGACVGTVIATQGAIIPAAVGVDIGCGMIAVKTKLTDASLHPGMLPKIRAGLERRIPMSAGKFRSKISPSAQERIDHLTTLAGDVDLDKKFGTKDWPSQLGTLGGGNHFIELCLDEDNVVWATLHSGSRGIGNKIGNHYIKQAQELCEMMFIPLKDRDLAYLPKKHPLFDEYLHFLNWAQTFALHNREEMMDQFLMELADTIYGDYSRFKELEVERINCHHNFTQMEHHLGHDVWVTRKGAVQVKKGMKAMIPGSMGTRSYIVRGLENPMAFHSSPHGAGRRFSRTKAREQFTMEDFDKAMVGIEHRRDEAFLDEIPGAYKDIDEVMENAKELVEVETTLKQILNCKGE